MRDSARIEIFERERRHLLAIAFRIAASQADAEDVVQEAWLRFAATDVNRIHNIPAWLTTVVTRLCLDVLRRRQELSDTPEVPAGANGDEPEEMALLADELNAAFSIVLQELTPPQRVALVLHDAFGTPFDEIAHILQTTEASARKMASRARRSIRQRATAAATDNETARPIVNAFLHAAQDGNIDRLVELLDPNVVRLADPQVLPAGGEQRIQGRDAVIAQTLSFRASAMRAKPATIDGRPGLAVVGPKGLTAVLVICVQESRITRYDVIADPQRVARLKVSLT